MAIPAFPPLDKLEGRDRPSVTRRLWDRRATYLSESALSAAVFAPAVDAADELLAAAEELEVPADDDDPIVRAVAI
jgi:hypothetical protein